MYLCPRCQRALPRDSFGHHARKPGARNTYCRDCMLDRQRAYRSTERGRAQAAAASRRYLERKRSGIAREVPAAA